MGHQLNSIKKMNSKLSILKNAKEGMITYYVGDNPDHVKHLSKCKLICKKDFDPSIDSVELIKTENPQLYFYKLSSEYKEDYLDNDNLIYHQKYNSYIHKNTIIPENVKIGPNCVIGDVEIGEGVNIHSNITIYSKTKIGKNTTIESNSVIGSAGVMWVWDGIKRVYLEQLGGVNIGDNCRIGSLVEIVRGSANETTIIENDVCMAHGCLIGHGSFIGEFTHLANGVKLGGSAHISPYNFLGSGSIISAGISLNDVDIIVGSGGVVVKNINNSGVYVGNPVKKIKESDGKLNGIPKWDKLNIK